MTQVSPTTHATHTTASPAISQATDIEALHPLDEHNQKLQANVHPTNWTNPTPKGRYNLVVIGAGTAGLVTAAGAAGLGAKVALIERSMMGGDCLNVGCVPSKALIRSAHAIRDVRDAHEFGVRIQGEPTVDFAAVMERMRRLRAGISPNDSVKRFSELGIDVFIGQAEFQKAGQIKVGDQTLSYAKAVIATGARAADLPIPGLKEAGYLTNETVFSLTELPARLVVIGAGPIGCELAQSFARFGSKVTLVESSGHILPREDPEAAKRVQASLERDGVQIVSGGKDAIVSREGDERIITLKGGSQPLEIRCEAIVAGVGRTPNVEGLNLEAVGVDYDARAGVKVDDKLRTSNNHIYAAGDICSRYKFTHTADAMARIVIQNALFFGRAKTSALTIPWCTYTDPEIAHVGLYEHEAKEKGIELQTFQIELDDVDRAILDGQTAGMLKVHVKKGTDKILGATLVASHAGDMISEITLAMTAGIGLGKIGKTIHPYPTQAEVIKKAADAYSRTRLTPFVKNIFTTILNWRR